MSLQNLYIRTVCASRKLFSLVACLNSFLDREHFPSQERLSYWPWRHRTIHFLKTEILTKNLHVHTIRKLSEKLSLCTPFASYFILVFIQLSLLKQWNIVTYWPSNEPSIKRCTCVNKQRNSGNRCIRSRMLEYHLDQWTWLNSVQMSTPTGSRWVSNNYIIRCHRRLESVGVQVAVPVGDKMPEWGPAPDRGLGPSGPTVEHPSQNAKEVLLWSEELWVNM